MSSEEARLKAEQEERERQERERLEREERERIEAAVSNFFYYFLNACFCLFGFLVVLFFIVSLYA